MQQRVVSIYVIGPSVSRDLPPSIHTFKKAQIDDNAYQSTGKTTLCNALAQRLGLPVSAYVTEIARQIMKEKGYSRDTVGLLQMQQDILDAHIRQEARLDWTNYPIRLFDRSAIDPIVYAILTSRDKAEADARKNCLIDTEEFGRVLARYRSTDSVVVLLNPVQEWLQDDGIRSMEKQEESLEIFEAILQEMGINYHQFGKNSKLLEERVVSIMGWARL